MHVCVRGLWATCAHMRGEGRCSCGHESQLSVCTGIRTNVCAQQEKGGCLRHMHVSCAMQMRFTYVCACVAQGGHMYRGGGLETCAHKSAHAHTCIRTYIYTLPPNHPISPVGCFPWVMGRDGVPCVSSHPTSHVPASGCQGGPLATLYHGHCQSNLQHQQRTQSMRHQPRPPNLLP